MDNYGWSLASSNMKYVVELTGVACAFLQALCHSCDVGFHVMKCFCLFRKYMGFFVNCDLVGAIAEVLLY